MHIFKRNITPLQLQAILWIIAFVLNFISNLQYDPAAKSIDFALLSMLFYVVIIYGNGFWLIPKFYNKQKVIIYVLLALLLLAAAIFLRSLAAAGIVNYFAGEKKIGLTTGLLAYSAFSGMWIFLFSILYRLAMDYFALSKTQGEIKAEKIQTELHLLKQQVHPHFLFNTLNNIYYVAQKNSSESADLIERLSSIMRYFIEESEKERVYLKDEIDLLRSYIELESIRMRYEMLINFKVSENIGQVTLPPLLLLPLVENIFKHGLDKRSESNFADISLNVDNERLLFTTQNKYLEHIELNAGGKTGLINLKKRLKLYYNDNFQLIAKKEGSVFITSLQIPVYEN